MTAVVADASAVTAILLGERPASGIAEAFQNRHVVAPDFALVEVANALWKGWRRGVIPGEQVSTRLDEARALIASLVSAADLLDRAAALSVELSHPVYDCLYIALAEHVQAPLITADKRLAVVATATLPDVKAF